MSRPMDNPDTRKADEMVVDMLESIEVREERHLLVSKEKKEPGLQAVLEDTRTRSEDSDSSMEYELVELEDSRITQKQEQEAKDHALAQEIQEAERAESDTSSSDSDETALPQKKSWTAMVIGGSSGTSDKYKARAKHYKLRYIEVSHELERKRKEASSFTQQWSTLLMENQSHAQYIRRIEEENRGLKFELQNVKQQLSDAVNLSEVRGKELKGAQVFLTKADSLSTSDVVQKVLDLNDEIFQAAALLGETLAYQVYEDGVDRVEARQSLIQGSMERARWMLGPRLAEILAKESLKPPKEATNPLLVQIVMQSALTQWCYSVAHRWCTGTEHDNEVIQNLYEDIRATEEQAVAGRWRSLTRAHLQTSATGWVQNVRDGIIPVMQVAGWTCADLFQFEKRLPSIFKALQDIRKATGEDVTSTDLEVITVVDGKGFDPNFMEDAYGDGRGDSSALKAVGKSGDGDDPPAHLVVASVGLGLRQVILKRHSNGAVSKRATWIASPKVVLEKTIKEAIEPPPPTTRRRKRNGGEGVVGAAMSAVANLVSGSGPSPSNNA
ncbi:hypothetical protein FA15DRAFT_671321 [Coprinopsis marcescibilis]|uniref:Uncharacterized protein n=1 Tax=Coprinopsis marcescibilis TaxID=230819 RepID=A0A5C3KQJ0_COPMA|nr:hypothetical protein FA15DRAFT_671321 [Coprinopsis marcescibilis]